MMFQNLDPSEAHDWVQLLIIDVIVILGAIFAFWNWLIKPIQTKIKKVREDLENDIKTERDARKAADAHRDERTREITREMTTAIGRVEITERRMERSEDDRRTLHAEIDEIRTRQEMHDVRLRESELRYERSMGEINTTIARLETRMLGAIREAVREVAKSRRPE